MQELVRSGKLLVRPQNVTSGRKTTQSGYTRTTRRRFTI